MNEVVVLERIGDPDDGMFSCYTGTIDGNGVKSIATFPEERRIDGRIKAFLRKTNKSLSEYGSSEELLLDLKEYLSNVKGEPK